MATVRMSHQLKYDIRNNYKIAFNKVHPLLQIGSYSSQPKIDTNISDSLYTQYYKPLYDKYHEFYKNPVFANVKDFDQIKNGNEFYITLPLYDVSYGFDSQHHNEDIVEYCGTDRAADLSKDPERNVRQIVLEPQSKSVKLYTSSERPFAVAGQSYGGSEIHQLQFIQSDVQNCSNLTAIQETMLEFSKLKVLRAFEVSKLSILLEKFTTLNQALKAWDGIRNLVDSDRLAKVNEKVYRKRKQQKQKQAVDTTMDDVGINDTLLTASLLEDD
jgi:hypothetical protein